MAWGPKLLPVSIVKVREQKTEKWAILSSDIRNPWLKKYKTSHSCDRTFYEKVTL